MSLSASALGSLIDSNLTGFGANGSNKTIFSNAVAAGIVMSIAGKAFATIDIGTIPGSGIGSGTGLTGMSSSNMASIALGVMPSTGLNAPNLMQAIMNAVVAHLGSSATLTSTHTPVFAGSGTIVVGSIPVTISEMASNIDSQLGLAGAAGSNRTILSTAIATGIVTEILAAATGTVTISGSPSGIPVGGGGSGSGVIS
jgi:hypothetical protein